MAPRESNQICASTKRSASTEEKLSPHCSSGEIERMIKLNWVGMTRRERELRGSKDSS